MTHTTHTQRVVELRRLYAAGAELLRSYPEGDSVLSPFAPFAAALREKKRVEVVIHLDHFPPEEVFGWVWMDSGTVMCQPWKGESQPASESRVPLWSRAVRLLAALAAGAEIDQGLRYVGSETVQMRVMEPA